VQDHVVVATSLVLRYPENILAFTGAAQDLVLELARSVDHEAKG